MATSTTSTTLPPGRKAGEDAARAIGDTLGATVDTAKVGANAVADKAKETKDRGIGATIGDAAEDAGDAIKSIKWPQLLMGLLGVLGSWFVSTMLGGGWMGTIAFALLAIPGFFMGRDLGTKWFGDKDTSPRGRAEPQLARAPEVAAPAQDRSVARDTAVVLQPRPRTAIGAVNGALPPVQTADNAPFNQALLDEIFRQPPPQGVVLASDDSAPARLPIPTTPAAAVTRGA